MNGHPITMLGTGLIGDFYTNTLHGQRGRDRVRVVYSRSGRARRRRSASVGHPRIDDRPGGRGRPSGHRRRRRRPAQLPARGGGRRSRPGRARPSCARSRSAGPPRRRAGCSRRSRTAGVFAGYLEDLCYTPKTLKAVASVEAGAIGDVTWVRSRETHPGPALRLVLGRPADRRRRDHRPRLPLHRDHPQLRRQGEPPGRGPVPHRHARPPDRRRGQRGRAHPLRIGRDRPVRGELDVPRRDGPARRGRRHARDDLAEPLPADRVRDVHAPVGGGGYVAEKAETIGRLAVPGRRRGVASSATSTCSATCSGRSTRAATPRETFYDGYVVNAIMDAAYRSAKAHAWEPSTSSGAAARRRGSPRRRRCTRARSSSSARSCPTAGTS